DVVQPGTEVGVLKAEIAAEIGCDPIKVIAAGSHDTASAVAAVPASDENWAYLSCGTWSLMGVESDDVVINNDTYEYSFTNEGGVGNTIRLLKNIMGLWVLQQCRSDWNEKGDELSYAQLAEMAAAAEPFKAFVCPNDSTFFAPGNMPERINEYLKTTGQQPIDDKGQMVRVILEGLALTYRWVFEKLQEVTGKRIDVLHIVGGGIKNELLCQFAANAIGRKVITGPVEATASGNIIMQAIGTGELGSLAEARKLVGNSFELKEYLPQDADLWEKQYKKIEDKIKP
ncbi:MAG: rhamnulokinase, partial [Anaerohalosphaera sp.]|nr:rhamnulokinase [Anaerohalosphaera sp.]